MRATWKKTGALLLTGILLLGSSLMVSAEEITIPAGYHVYETNENEATDTWYSIARGVLVQSVTSRITKNDSTHVACSGSTECNVVCDNVYVTVYLDKSSNGTSGWGTVNYWSATTSNKSIATVSSGSYKVASGNYYSVKGSHTAKKSGYTTESTTSCTNAIKL